MVSEFGEKWYIYFAMLAGAIVVLSIILLLWGKQSNTKIAKKNTNRAIRKLLKAKEGNNPVVNLLIAQNYLESALYYLGEDERRVEDVAVIFEKTEVLETALRILTELNKRGIKNQKKELIQTPISKTIEILETL